jgi:hypothetical protein
VAHQPNRAHSRLGYIPCAAGFAAPHLVPLSQIGQRVFKARRGERTGRLSSPASAERPFSGWSKAKSALDSASGVSGWWLHDLRRTLATGLQRLGARLEVTEAVLNHLSGSRAGIVGIYQRQGTFDSFFVRVIAFANALRAKRA